MPSKSVSPVGWYVGSYLLRFVELNDPGKDDPQQEFLTWENTVIVQADNLDHAYDKIVALAAFETESYQGGPEGVPVRWVFEGMTELLPIYEELADGAEIMWAEHEPTRLEHLRQRICSRDELIRPSADDAEPSPSG
ncbi:DUF4288 domain-containing protein [Lysobacter sp. Root983]|uniref:DUF4288 domain-containing protein n=1 Tax=Lysobacter sp. Root983 TaxID=1736613 RepID=UPI00070EBE2B|nr:DUF4288 domain-containing protein [Lysobacter sp. Root983]KRD74883.1 hypothetical protein ASE43_16910 [Lysobacter sp. Root983]